ncbi:MAG TPA: chemotaxis protein CheA [Spirochaetia bacterium]|nr:chemotaxis protein CheA [Spirochaetia bacterium]
MSSPASGLAASADDPRLRRAFLEEADELSQKLGESLQALEADPSNMDTVNEVFRLTHSLKSESAFMGFARLSELAHRMEDVLGLVRSGSLSLGRPVMDAVFSGADRIAETMAALTKGGTDTQFENGAILQSLSAAAGRRAPRAGAAGPGAAGPAAGTAAAPTVAPHPAAPAAAVRTGTAPADPGTAAPGEALLQGLGDFERAQLAEARDRGEECLRVTVTVDDGEPMKFPRAWLVFAALESAANVVRTVPPLDGEPAEDAAYARMRFLLTTADPEEVVRVASGVDQIAAVKVERCRFDELLSAVIAGAPEAEAGAAESGGEAGSEASASAASAVATGAGGETADSRTPTPPEKTSIRVDTKKLDDLWSLIADLVLNKSRIAHLSENLGKGMDPEMAREELAEAFDDLDKISGGMQQAMMDTRMIPISVIFNKFPRLVRDLCRKLGKSVELSVSGEETEIDRSIVEALSDPLTHIIRNSLDHGIEFPEERVRRGKSEKGRVSVSARRQGGTIVIELSDDGRGIDVPGIRRKALGMGISGAESFTEAQLLDLVFLPGFSTKEVVTDLSGRGVGMDVVATRVRRDLKGDVALDTVPDRGTRVTLFLPLTLTIVNALLVRGGTQLYALPLTEVDSTAKLTSSELRGEGGRESAAWEEEEIPVFSLGVLFDTGRRRSDEYFALVLRHRDRRAFLVVDELIEEREVVIKPVDDLLNAERLFSGVSVLEDGRLVFILDTSFIRRENSDREAPWAPAS